MKRTLNLIGSFVFAAILGASAHAACGGGGYSQSTQSSPPVQRTEYRQTTSNGGAAMIARMDTARFDQQIRPRLNISQQQSKDIDKLETEVKQKTDNSIATAQSFDARHEFDQRLAEILTPDQYRVYRSLR